MRVNCLLTKFSKAILGNQSARYSIATTNTSERKIFLSERGFGLPICLKFDELYKNLHIIPRLNKKDIAMMGYLVAKHCDLSKLELNKIKFRCQDDFSFLLEGQDRGGRIIYFDYHSKNIIVQSVFEIFDLPELINKFSKKDAFLIGVAAGKQTEGIPMEKTDRKER